MLPSWIRSGKAMPRFRKSLATATTSFRLCHTKRFLASRRRSVASSSAFKRSTTRSGGSPVVSTSVARRPPASRRCSASSRSRVRSSSRDRSDWSSRRATRASTRSSVFCASFPFRPARRSRRACSRSTSVRCASSLRPTAGSWLPKDSERRLVVRPAARVSRQMRTTCSATHGMRSRASR